MKSFFWHLLAQWLTPLQARIAEEAGAVAVMALERVPADIRVEGGVARMSDPKMIKEIMAAVTIPVMAKARIGHFVECQVCPLLFLPTLS
jgi:pyridoxal 5'-phosphate synthase pdxS subunit